MVLDYTFLHNAVLLKYNSISEYLPSTIQSSSALGMKREVVYHMLRVHKCKLQIP